MGGKGIGEKINEKIKLKKETILRLRGHWEYSKASSFFLEAFVGSTWVLSYDWDQYEDAIVAVRSFAVEEHDLSVNCICVEFNDG